MNRAVAAVAPDIPSSIPAFNAANGVALLTASVPGVKNADEVILTGQEANNIALAANAGFMKLCPKPPKQCFTMAIANMEPMATIHKGAVEGTLNANKMPVTTALKSLTVTGLFNIFCIATSAATANTTETKVTINDLIPK